MGRDLSAAWPDILRKQQHSNRRLRRQYIPHCFWDQPRCVPLPHERLSAQVALGTLVTDLLVNLGIRPDAALGYSLGESTALFALQAWTDRDTMFSCLEEATLFRSDLSAPCLAARSRWHLPADEEVDWLAGSGLLSGRRRTLRFGGRNAGLPADHQHRGRVRDRRPAFRRAARGRAAWRRFAASAGDGHVSLSRGAGCG